MTLATCSRDLKLYTWPGLTFAGSYQSPDECGTIKTISWCRDGKSLMAVNGKDHPFILTCPQANKEIEPNIVLKNVSPSCGVFSNTSCSSVAFGDQDGSVYIYDLKKRRKVNQYESVPASVAHIDFSSEDTCLAAGCANGQLILYAATAKPCASYVVPQSRTLSVMRFSRFQPDVLAAASKEGVLSVWNASKGSSLIVGKDHVGTITDLDFFGDTVATVGADGKLISYDMRVGDYQTCHNLNVTLSCVAFAPNAHELAVGTSDGHLRSYDRRFMTSPTNTVVAYDSPVKGMSFRPLATSPVSSRPTTKSSEFVAEDNKDSGRYKSCDTEAAATTNTTAAAAGAAMTTKQPPASAGDYNPDLSPSSSTIMSMNQEMRVLENIYLHETLPPSASQIEMEAPKSNDVSYDELIRFTNDIEEALRQHMRRSEDKMLAEFFRLRIDISKQFIELQDKIGKSWDGFTAFLKSNMNEEYKNESGGGKRRHRRREDEEGSMTTTTMVLTEGGTMSEDMENSVVFSEAKTNMNMTAKLSDLQTDNKTRRNKKK